MINKLKIGIIVFLCLFSFSNIHDTFANGNIEIKVTTKIPGAGCTGPDEKNNHYTCTIQPGFNSVLKTISGIIKWFTAIGVLAGVLFIVVNGILLSMGGMDSSAKEEAKKRISKSIIGLILLLMSGYILHIIAPWVYTI